MMISKSDVFSVFVIMIALTILLGIVLSFPIMLLWNYCLVPAVAGTNEITWLQAWGLYVLFNILFKSSSGGSR